MRTPPTDIFGSVEENNDENIEEEEEQEEEEEEVEEEQGEEEPEDEETSSSEDDDDEPDPWRPLRQKKLEKISKKPTWKKSNSSWIEEDPNTMPKMPLSTPCYL